jgi:hypothetical protein
VTDPKITVHLQDILEGPLLGPDGQELKQLARSMPEEYEQWIDAQLFSRRASQKYANYQDTIKPLENTRKKHVLDTMWKNINLVAAPLLISGNCLITRLLRITKAFPEQISTRYGILPRYENELPSGTRSTYQA